MQRIALSLAALVVLAVSAHAAPAKKGPPTVAIMYFDYDGKDGELAMLKKGLAQMLISDLAGHDGIRVVEREQLQQVLGELKLQASNKIDQATAVKAGKLLGARYLVLGAYFDVMKTLRADARIVDVETGRVLLSVGAAGKPEDFLVVEQKLAGDLGAYFTANAPAPKTKVMLPKKKRPKPPATLKAKTAVEYGKALAALDSGDKKAAKEGLEKVVKEQPDFELASLDLDKLMK